MPDIQQTSKSVITALCQQMRTNITAAKLLPCNELSLWTQRSMYFQKTISSRLRDLELDGVLVRGDGDATRKRVYAINPQYCWRTAPTKPKVIKSRKAQKPAKCDVVPPQQYNIFRAPPYVQEANYAMRPGAMDFKDIQSVGF